MKELHEGEGKPPVQRPEGWGGFALTPTAIEFWQVILREFALEDFLFKIFFQGQSTRIHDRLRFRRLKEGEAFVEETTEKAEDGWVIERVAP